MKITQGFSAIGSIFSLSNTLRKRIVAHESFEQHKGHLYKTIFVRFAWLLLALCIDVSVSFPFSWSMTALHKHDTETFKLAIIYFIIIALASIPIQAFDFYLNEMLYIRTRKAITNVLLEIYHSNFLFYHLMSMPEIDNPGQRLDENVDDYVFGCVGFSLIIMTNLGKLIGWTIVLWWIGAATIIYGFVIAVVIMLIAIIVFASKLMQIAFVLAKDRSEFRAGIIRTRDNGETIAFYGASDFEKTWSIQRLATLLKHNVTQANWRTGLAGLSHFTRYTSQVLPLVLLAPKFFRGEISMGSVMQACYGFASILMALTVIVSELNRLSNIQAAGKRVVEILDASDIILTPPSESNDGDDLPVITPRNLSGDGTTITINIGGEKDHETTQNDLFNGIKLTMDDDTLLQEQKVLKVNNMSIIIPNTSLLILHRLNMEINKHQNVLIVGPSGSGKSSLLRVLCGLWKNGAGSIVRLSSEHASFLPQKPYLPILPDGENTLANQLLFPHYTQDNIDKKTLNTILEDVNLRYVLSADDCDKSKDWSKSLSLGEQQRLGFGRILISKPSMLFLDESTSALDTKNQALMYKLLQRENISYVSVGHRPNLTEFHDIVLSVTGDGNWDVMSCEEYTSSLQD